MTSGSRLVTRVEPFGFEDLTGFLMRVSAANYLSGPSKILHRIAGSPNAAVERRHLLPLADFCRTTPQEVTQLSGYEARGSTGERLWHIAGEWVSKVGFVRLRDPKVCPICLDDGGCIEGVWELTYYAVCAKHGIYLVERCSDCGKLISWNRPSPLRCRCGWDIRRGPTIHASLPGILLARLIANRSTAGIDLRGFSHLIADKHVDRFADLSLDGLLKTIWFLGHYLAHPRRIRACEGRKVLPFMQVEETFISAMALLEDWPNSLPTRLSLLAAASKDANATGWMEPLDYWRNELGDELGQLRTTYEWYVRQMWKELGGRTSRSNDRQLEFKLW